jgi:transposase
VLVIVDQPNTIGALPIAVARDCGCTVAYLPGLAMRKAADLYPGKSKTDALDAFIIAETARAMPHTLRSVDRDSEVLAALKVLSGFDADLTHECTRAINRLRSLLLQIFPALERVFPGTVLIRSLVLELFIKYSGPTGLRAVGRSNVLRWARNHSRKDPVSLVEAIFMALGEQTVTVIGTEAVELVIPRVAAQIKELSGNKQLKNALFRSAWIASCHHPASQAYYQKKRAQGKKRNAAVICLARRRCDVIYSMLRHGTFYD